MPDYDERILHGTWTRDIVTLLELDETAPDMFRNRFNQPNAYRALFGGQIVAQALAAADRTVESERSVHSLHSYFLRAGSDGVPIDYSVERIRDGGRFSTRRVTAQQGDQVIFTMECSYRTAIAGFSHYRPTAIPFTPEEALDEGAVLERLRAINVDFAPQFTGYYPVEVRVPDMIGYVETVPEAKRHYWLRAPGAERVNDPAIHRQILTFLSDFMFAGTPLSQHTVALPGPHVFVASLDHNMWFHRDLRCDDWLLFETESPNAEKGVNLARGLIYNRAGELVASMVQEALQYPLEEVDD